jgi:exonuclease V gamma subunit
VLGQTVVEATTSKPSDKRLVEPWLRLLLLSAAKPGDWKSVVCSARRVATVSSVQAEAATAQLDHLVGLMLDGWDRPLPLPPRVGYELADPRGLVDDERLRKLWGFDVDATWLLFFEDLAAVESAAESHGGLRRLAQETYGPLQESLR